MGTRGISSGGCDRVREVVEGARGGVHLVVVGAHPAPAGKHPAIPETMRVAEAQAVYAWELAERVGVGGQTRSG